MKAIKALFLCLALLFGVLNLYAQTPEWQWAIRAGGTADDASQSITIDNQGNQLVTGKFSGVATFGSYTLTSTGLWDIFVAKIDPTGTFLWAVTAGGADSDLGASIAVDCEGNTFLTGYFQSSATFGSHTLTSGGGNDIFAAKLDTFGNWIWAVKAGGSYLDAGRGMAVDNMGNCYLTGAFFGTAIFGTHALTSVGYYEIFAAKLDAAGNWLWAVSAGGPDVDSGRGIAVDNAGNSYVTGLFYDTATFGAHTLTSSGEYDVFAAKLDPTGNWLWAFNAGGTYYDYGLGIALDTTGNAYLTGWFAGTATFGPYTFTSNGDNDIFTAKLDFAGNCLWAVQAGGISSDTGYGIAVDNEGGVWLTGSFYGTATFGTHALNSSGDYDIFAARIDPTGSFLWVGRAGGTNSDDGYAIALDSAGNAYLTGNFSGTASFGTHTLNSSGDYDICIAKLYNGTPSEDDLAPGTYSFSKLYDACPNPLRQGERVLIKADIAERDTGTLRIFNLRGQLVASHKLGPGFHQITLDSRDLAAGIYLYLLDSGSYREVKKLVLMK